MTAPTSSPWCCCSRSPPTPAAAGPTTAPASGTCSPAARSAASGPAGLIDYAMAPVWEANNVWLVFVLVITWTGFPAVFQTVFSTDLARRWPSRPSDWCCAAPGSPCASRPQRVAGRRRYGAVFAVSSSLTPFFLGGGRSAASRPAGSRRATAHGDPVTSWLNPTSVLFGLLGL